MYKKLHLPFVLISALMISIVAIFYLFFDNGKDGISKTNPNVAYENSTYEPEKYNASFFSDH